MFLKKINLKGIGPRLIISTTIILFVSLLFVSSVIYYLLADSLRESDQNLLRRLAETYTQSYSETDLNNLHKRISPEIMVVIVDKKGKEIFSHMPTFIDHDFEDEDEIKQLKTETRKIPLTAGWTTILLLSGEENQDFFQRIEYQLRLLAQKKDWVSLLPIIDNDLIEVLVTPMNQDLWMKIGRSSEEREEHLSSIRYIAFMVFIPFIFIGILLSTLMARSVLKPVRQLVETIKLIGGGKSSARGEVRDVGDEIDILSTEFNSLLDKNQNLLNNIRNTVDNLAHDMRTPITRFKISAENVLMNDSSPDEMREALRDVLENSDEILGLFNAIMDVAEAESQTMALKLEVVNVSQLIEDVVDLYQFVADEKKVKLRTIDLKEIYITCDKTRMLQAFSNLLDNAIKYSEVGTTVTISTALQNSNVSITFIDEGQGIPEEDVERIWDRLYRTDKSRSTPGLGIGLSLVKAIIKVHKGTVSVISWPGKGSQFIVTLPLCNAPETIP